MMLEAVVGSIGASVMAIFGWAFSLNSRMGVQERAHDDLIKLIDTKFEAVKELNQAIIDKMDTKFDAQGQRLDRIERSMNGHLAK